MAVGDIKEYKAVLTSVQSEEPADPLTNRLYYDIIFLLALACGRRRPRGGNMNVVISILLVFIAVAFAGYFISLVAKGPLFFSYFFLGMTVFLELMAVKLWRDMGQPVDHGWSISWALPS